MLKKNFCIIFQAYFKVILGRIEALELELQDEKSKLKRYMEKARRVIVDLEEQSRAVESGALSRHEFDSIRKERDAYKQNVCIYINLLCIRFFVELVVNLF